MSRRYQDFIFQAKCQMDFLDSAFEEGGRLISCDGNEVEIRLPDNVWTTIYIEPIKELISALEKLPQPDPDDAD